MEGTDSLPCGSSCRTKGCELQRAEFPTSCILSFLKPETSSLMGCAAGLQIVPVARFSGNRWTNCQHFFGRGWCCDWIGNIGVLALRSIVPSVSFYFCPERDSVDGHENRRGGVPKGRYSTTNLSMDSFPFFKTVRLFLGSLFCVSLLIKCKFLFQYFRCVFPSFYPLFIFKMAILLSPHAFFLQTPLVGSTNICPCLTAMGDDGEWCSLSLSHSLSPLG